MFCILFVLGVIMCQRESYIEKLVKKNMHKSSSADKIIIKAK